MLVLENWVGIVKKLYIIHLEQIAKLMSVGVYENVNMRNVSESVD